MEEEEEEGVGGGIWVTHSEMEMVERLVIAGSGRRLLMSVGKVERFLALCYEKYPINTEPRETPD